MRRVAGWALLVVALLCLLGGAAMAVLLGPDDMVRTDPQPLGTEASVVVTSPEAIEWSGPSVQVDATLPDDRPLFIGLGNAVDVSDYTDGVEALVVDDVDVPFSLDVAEVGGGPALPAKPSSLDWWLASDRGRGGADLTAQLPAEPSQLLVAAVDGGDLEGLEVQASFELEGGFGVGLGLVGLAAGVALFAFVVLRRRPEDEYDPDEEPGEKPDKPAGKPGDPPSDSPADKPANQPAGKPVRKPAAKPAESHAQTGRGTTRRAGALAGALVLLVGTAGCSVLQPVDDEPNKTAVTRPEADVVVARWVERSAEALRVLDADALRLVEGGDTLAVDRGALTVARRLFEQGPQQLSPQLELRSVLAPRLSAYPLWFLAVVDDGDRGFTKVQVYERHSAAASWHLVETAEVLPSTRLPDLALDDTGALEPVAPDDATGLGASPQEVADLYAALLADPDTSTEGLVQVDSFVQQMRSDAQTLQAIEGVRFSQRWRAGEVEWAARTRDGGALVFATMRRYDGYQIKPDTAVDWGEGSEPAAFLAGRAYTSAVLRYRHQVLLYVPPDGGGQVRALGQYGGVVSASGT